MSSNKPFQPTLGNPRAAERWRSAKKNMKAIHLLITLLSLCALSDVMAQTSVAEQQDAEVLASLRSAGSDLSKPHDIDFFLIFSSKVDATPAAKRIRELGFRPIGIESSPDGDQWQVHAKREMVPALDALNGITRTFEELAAEHRGYYDGWGTIPVR